MINIEAVRARLVTGIVERWPNSPLAADVAALLAEVERLNLIVAAHKAANADLAQAGKAEIAALREALEPGVLSCGYDWDDEIVMYTIRDGKYYHSCGHQLMLVSQGDRKWMVHIRSEEA